MKASAIISDFIMKMLDEADGDLELKRNELAQQFNVVPSQINYVITSRFSPEHGFRIESHRGGGGYVRIVRKEMHRDEYLMHFFHSIGTSLSEAEAVAMLRNLCATRAVETDVAAVMRAALSDRALTGIEDKALRDRVRADLLRQLVLSRMVTR